MPDALLFVLLSLSSYRLWRLIGWDDITEPARRWLFSETPKGLRRWVRDLVECPWCAGTWLSVASTYALHRYVIPLKPHWLLWAVACSCAVGLISQTLDADE